MSKAGEQIIAAAQSGIGEVRFLNPFNGRFETFINEREQTISLLKAAAQRIAEQQEEIDRIKAHLVLD